MCSYNARCVKSSMLKYLRGLGGELLHERPRSLLSYTLLYSPSRALRLQRRTLRTSDRWSVWSVWSVATTVHDLDLSGQMYSWCAWSSSCCWMGAARNLQGVAHVPLVGPVLHRSCTKDRHCGSGSIDDLQYIVICLSDVWNAFENNDDHNVDVTEQRRLLG